MSPTQPFHVMGFPVVIDPTATLIYFGDFTEDTTINPELKTRIINALEEAC
jgi:hypothetical protein